MAAENVLATQVTAGAVIAYFVNYLKGSKYFPWITEETKVVSRFISAVLAAGTAVGVHTVWSPESHTLTITGLTAVGIAGALWAFSKQYAIQHLTSKVMYPNGTNGTRVPQVPKV